MKSLSYFDGQAQQVAKHPVDLVKLEWRGGDSLAAARFLQVHDVYGVPANGVEPVKCWPIYTAAAGYKLFDVGELRLVNGLYICVSTAEATKTLAAGSDKWAALAVELARAEEPNGTTFAGDLTTADEVLQVWSEAAGLTLPKRLFEIITTNGDVLDYYLQIHAANTPTDASLVQSILIPDGETKRITFGLSGKEISRRVSGSLKYGCTLAYSSTETTYTAIGSNVGAIQAEYKA